MEYDSSERYRTNDCDVGLRLVVAAWWRHATPVDADVAVTYGSDGERAVSAHSTRVVWRYLRLQSVDIYVI